ncbi:uncharacterized protein LOC123014660 [Tribolium madens]|uniref:uncharacterized protein LOC123014660 n=1 Tax=Tribolium madens TaxID=41895 RepID=UPI001CF73963|nr:uncharacterized protein LOC123014660 [Tribolium madens]
MKTKVHKKNSASEPDLNTAGRNHKSGFPPGTTVDELWLYRRKRASENEWPSDNLKLREGSFKLLKSEYTRRFKDFWSCENLREDISPTRRGKPDDHLILEGLHDLHPLYKENFVQYPIERLVHRPTTSSFQIIDSNENEMRENSRENERLLTDLRSRYPPYPPQERPPLIRRKTNLKLEGDLYTTTEKAEKFIQYLLTNKRPMRKKPTTLKLEGEMNINTENREKYVPYEIAPRPPLCKKFTNLHLEGDLSILTEKQEKFVRYDVQKRPPLTKKHTNLVIEGELDLLPEYRREFIEYKTERPKLALPVNNLKTNGFFDVVPDVSAAFQQQIHPQIPNLRGGEGHEDMALKTRLGRTPENSLVRVEAPMESETESRTQFVEKASSKSEPAKITNHLHLEGRIDLNPEYRNAYIDFNKEVSAPRTRRRGPESHLKSEGKMEISPEYKCSYVDFPRTRPQVKRPENSLSSEGEIDHMTEKNEKYVPFSNVPRTGPLKRDTELKLEGNIECQPEYRKAYIDYLIRERVDRKSRPLDNLGQPPRRIIETEPVEKTVIHSQTPAVKEEPPKRAKSTRNRSLSQIETSVFGPKLTVPDKPPSRSSSPKPPSRRRSRTVPRNASNSSDSDVPSRKHKTFGKPVLVENLASRSTTPVLPLIDVSARNKWMRDSSLESSSAFVVLDKNVKKEKWTPWQNY